MSSAVPLITGFMTEVNCFQHRRSVFARAHWCRARSVHEGAFPPFLFFCWCCRSPLFLGDAACPLPLLAWCCSLPPPCGWRCLPPLLKETLFVCFNKKIPFMLPSPASFGWWCFPSSSRKPFVFFDKWYPCPGSDQEEEDEEEEHMTTRTD